MKRTFIKVCGLRTPVDAEKLIGVDVDAAGIIFVPGVKRTVKPQDGAEIAKQIPTGVKLVGVWMDPSKEEMFTVCNRVNVDFVQLHGSESPAFCQWVKERFQTKVVKVFHAGIRSPGQLEDYAPWIDVALIDSFSEGKRGGTGKVFDWRILQKEKERWETFGVSVWVAGGLRVENVNQLLEQYTPDGVDVSSGVELDGVKDRFKMVQFVERVRAYDRQFR
ncbi:phosphoribosylanthranilate isomerase [Melghirimyces algeriensis]|uniref:N-(5'-phosphoribosyl)anthranilate isomerase n=1 Tax=Melghirimyces algeriensis TaxID=910412 RepID=A0A521B7P7_9BACL|nr:phosphoribosylanthranilate isomerase [Melghirimyces algeriensis]SMO42720.1 phosphoribosylanthranilate isomerase [Melghirimyces algeriensis]